MSNENFKMPPFLVNNAIHPEKDPEKDPENDVSQEDLNQSVEEIISENELKEPKLETEEISQSDQQNIHVREIISKIENTVTDFINEDATEYKVKSYANQIVDVILLNNNKENRLLSIIEQISDLKLNDENVITDSLNLKNQSYRDLLNSIETDMSGILEKIKSFKF